MFDLFVVAMSLIALGPIDMPISILRLMRAFRIVRIFGRIKALRNIITALTTSILPVLNAFVILLVIASICGWPSGMITRTLSSCRGVLTGESAPTDSIMGVTFFSTTAPGSFGRFDRFFNHSIVADSPNRLCGCGWI
jgi:hypothetical protein